MTRTRLELLLNKMGMGDLPGCPPTPPNYGNCGGILNLDPNCYANNAALQLAYTQQQIYCQQGIAPADQAAWQASVAANPPSIPAATPQIEQAWQQQIASQPKPVVQPPAHVVVYTPSVSSAPPVNSPVGTPPSGGTTYVIPAIPALSYNPTFNFTASGHSVGDSWQISISGGKPGDIVSATSSQNGTNNGSQNFGKIDSSGNFSLSGVFGASTIGNWTEQWSVGGKVIGNANFTIVPSVSSTTTSTIATSYNAQFSFNTTGYNVGDNWTISIVGGKPGASVSASSTQNGYDNGTQVLGSLDSNGSFNLQGTFSQGSIGYWTEQWMIDGSVIGAIKFTVNTPQSQQTSQQTGTSTVSNTTNTTSTTTNATGGSTQQSIPVPTYTPSTGASFMDILGDIQIGQYNIPVLGILAVGVGVMMLVSGHRGR